MYTMKKILVTGSRGRIGKAITSGLEGRYEFVPFDIKDGDDATNYQALREKLVGCSALIHLAYDLRHENPRTGRDGNPENLLMGQVVLAAAVQEPVANCIMASSAEVTRTQNDTNFMYRTTKRTLEDLANMQADRYPETHFTSIRFGHVNSGDNLPPRPPLHPDQSWISDQDTASLIECILENSRHSGHEIIYGLSDRPEPPYGLANPYGWAPVDSFGYVPGAEH